MSGKREGNGLHVKRRNESKEGGEGKRKGKKYHFVSLKLPGGTGAGGVDG